MNHTGVTADSLGWLCCVRVQKSSYWSCIGERLSMRQMWLKVHTGAKLIYRGWGKWQNMMRSWNGNAFSIPGPFIWEIHLHTGSVDPCHKSHNTLNRVSHNAPFVTEMCTHVYIFVTKWCIVGHMTDASWDLCKRTNMDVLFAVCLNKLVKRHNVHVVSQWW